VGFGRTEGEMDGHEWEGAEWSGVESRRGKAVQLEPRTRVVAGLLAMTMMTLVADCLVSVWL